jgi:hypothetical protein
MQWCNKVKENMSMVFIYLQKIYYSALRLENQAF